MSTAFPLPLINDGTDFTPTRDIAIQNRAALVALETLHPELFFKTGLATLGDSITAAYASSDPATKSFSYVITQNIGTNKYSPVLNLGVSGKKASEMLNDIQGTINSLDPTLYPNRVITVLAGINDLLNSTSTVAQIYGYIKSICTALSNAGWVVNICTQPCSSFNGGNNRNASQVETDRLSLCALIRDNPQVNMQASGLVDIAKDSRMGVLATQDMSLFTSDGLHPNDAGYAYLASLIQPALVTLAKGNTYGLSGGTTGTYTPPVVVTPGQPAGGNIRQFAVDYGYNDTTGTWTDKSGSGDAVQVENTGVKPILISNGLNNKPTLRFSQTPLKGVQNTGITGTQPHTLMAVVKFISSTSNNAANLLGIGNGLYSDNSGNDFKTSDMIILDQNLAHFSLGMFAATSLAVPYNQWHIVAVVRDAANSTMYVDSTSMGGFATHDLAIENAPLRIGGGHFNNPSISGLENYVAEFAEVILRNDADLTAFNANLSYLKTKYNL